MGSTVFANKQGISSANSGAVSTSGPDVCLTQVGNAVVPIPYTNVARSSTLENGSKTVKVDGASAAIDGCCYSSSTGDQAGSKKGIISGTVGDKAEFANCSFDVCIEGEGVCRNMDLMTHNNGNAIGTNRDSSADPPKPKQDPPPLDTVRIKVVEHLSWDNYYEKSDRFHLGHEDNKIIAGRKFKIKLPDGSEIEKTTDENGMIELTGQDPHGKFELTLETENAKLNKKYFLFSRAITPFKRSQQEQDDPEEDEIKHTKDDVVTAVHYIVSIYQPQVIVDSHMHIMSGGCSPLPFLWERIGGTFHLSREWIEGCGHFAGVSVDILTLRPVFSDKVEVVSEDGKRKIEARRKNKFRQALPVSELPTFEIGDNFVNQRHKFVHEAMQGAEFYKGAPNLISFCIAQTMDMEYAHIDGYFGLKVYNAILNDDKKSKEYGQIAGYWTPLHGHWIKQDRQIIRHDYHPLADELIDTQSRTRYEKNKEIVKEQGLPGVYYRENSDNQRIPQKIEVSVKATPLEVPKSEKIRYESWDDQLFFTELSMLKNPLKQLPMFHYDPRRWQVADPGEREFPFQQVGEGGLYLGFKIYTAQGYRPWDVRRLPILKEFYSRCSARGIPIMNHCTPEGAYCFDHEEYYKFIHPTDPQDDLQQRKAVLKAGDEERNEKNFPQGFFTGAKFELTGDNEAERYFQYDYIAPRGWEEVLGQKDVLGRNLNDLHLCLAHFGGNTKLGRVWSRQIIDLVKKYNNVYMDISSSFTNPKYRDFFKNFICSDQAFKDLIRHRILFGSDWYMTLLDAVDFMEYCDLTKKFLDTIDSSLWVRFTQVNPYAFYRIDEERQIGRIVSSIIEARKDDENIKEIGELKPETLATIKREAAYIKQANKPFEDNEPKTDQKEKGATK